MTSADEARPLVDAHVQAAALRTEFPQYVVSVLSRRGDRPRFEVVSRDGGSPYCLISTDALEIWRELRKGSARVPRVVPRHFINDAAPHVSGFGGGRVGL
jgi:hypothetical protein